MCVIIDANAISEVFGSGQSGGKATQSESGKQLFDWLDLKSGRLVVGGSKLQKELSNKNFRIWVQEADRVGKLRKHDDRKVDQKAKELLDKKACKSDDEHIVALAQISKARLLYSHDEPLHVDFKDAKLINRPRGKIFPTGDNPQDRKSRSAILADKNLCKK